MEMNIRAQYFKQSSLSPVWRLYLPVSYVTMLKLHGENVFMTKWYDFDIACVILMVGSCWCESLFTYYTVVPLAFGCLYRNLCQGAMEDLEM